MMRHAIFQTSAKDFIRSSFEAALLIAVNHNLQKGDIEECYGILHYELANRIKADSLSSKVFEQLINFLNNHVTNQYDELKQNDPELARKLHRVHQKLEKLAQNLRYLFELDIKLLNILPQFTNKQEAVQFGLKKLKKLMHKLIADVLTEMKDVKRLEKLITEITNLDLIKKKCMEKSHQDYGKC